MTTIYASTACLRGDVPLRERMDAYREHGIRDIELGANVIVGEPFDADDLPRPGHFLLHNYFPPPADPFVLNLASKDDAIRGRSVDLARQALSISAQIGAPTYSVHAGFITDPTLAFVFPKPDSPDARDEALRLFAESIRLLLPDAQKLGVRLLVENNVCLPGQRDLLLLVTTEDFQEFFAMMGASRPGILVDTGHLNVSSHTFGFDRLSFLDTLAADIGAFHLHENDGSADQHLPVSENGWITGMLRRPEFLGLPWIIEAKFPDVEAISTQWNLLRKIADGTAH